MKIIFAQTSNGVKKIPDVVAFAFIALVAAGALCIILPVASILSNPPVAQNQTASLLAKTEVIAYAPIAAQGVPTQSGSCWTSSIAAPYRADAFRCMVRNSISDPCFAIANTQNLLCEAFTQNQFVLKLTQPLPAPQLPPSTATNWAWRVQLADGTICTPFTGTRPFTKTGDVAAYGCNGNDGEKLIIGDLNNSQGVWTAKVGALSDPSVGYPPQILHSEIIQVAKVWQ